jgi:uncharacterized protein YacL
VSGEEPRLPAPRGTVVELIRLILVGLFTAGGWQIGRQVGADGTELLLWVVLGSLVGYVIGGVLGRRTFVAMSAVEREFTRMSASELLAGTIGLILGLLIAVLVSILLFRLPPAAASPTAALVTLVLTWLGFRLGRGKRDELFGMFGIRTRALGLRPGEVNVLDTSALIDGRVLHVVQSGFLGGTFLVTRGVLGELQSIADASDPGRRDRGQRGLDVLRRLQQYPSVEVVLVEEETPGDVDAQLVRLARDRGGTVVTTDGNLVKVAEALDVPTRSLHELAEAVRSPVTPGEELTVHLTKAGREHGQGVGFLEDGTMVVVERGQDLLGSDVRAVVTNVLQTSTGRMVFARLDRG